MPPPTSTASRNSPSATPSWPRRSSASKRRGVAGRTMAVSEATSDRALVVGTGGVAAPPVAHRGVRATLREELAEHWFAYALVLPSFLVLAVMIGYPVVNTFISAFSRVDPVGNIISVGTFAHFR